MENQKSKLLTLLVETAPVFYELITMTRGGDRNPLTITSTENYIYAVHGKDLDLGIRVGDPIKPGSGSRKCMDTRQSIRIELDRSVFGVPCIVSAYPLIENGHVVGCLSTATNISKRESITNAASQLESFFNTVFGMMSDVSEKSDDLSGFSIEMSNEATASKERLKNTTRFISGIKGIADQINLLSINASIEATRAKQPGFAVIAGETRRLADGAKNFVDQIQPFLMDIKNSSTVIEEKSNTMSTYSQELNKTSGSVLESLKDLTNLVSELKELSSKL